MRAGWATAEASTGRPHEKDHISGDACQQEGICAAGAYVRDCGQQDCNEGREKRAKREA